MDTLTKVGTSRETVVANILAVWDAATPEAQEQGRTWYDIAARLARLLSETGGITVEQAAVVIAHLSPRQKWHRNVELAWNVVHGGEARTLASQLLKAQAAMVTATPFDTFGPRSNKTRAFAANILGDPEAVTVDVWAARVAGVTEEQLPRVGVYDAVADAYREAARVAGVTPSVMQATTWVQARGKAE